MKKQKKLTTKEVAKLLDVCDMPKGLPTNPEKAYAKLSEAQAYDLTSELGFSYRQGKKCPVCGVGYVRPKLPWPRVKKAIERVIGRKL